MLTMVMMSMMRGRGGEAGWDAGRANIGIYDFCSLLLFRLCDLAPRPTAPPISHRQVAFPIGRFPPEPSPTFDPRDSEDCPPRIGKRDRADGQRCRKRVRRCQARASRAGQRGSSAGPRMGRRSRVTRWPGTLAAVPCWVEELGAAVRTVTGVVCHWSRSPIGGGPGHSELAMSSHLEVSRQHRFAWTCFAVRLISHILLPFFGGHIPLDTIAGLRQ